MLNYRHLREKIEHRPIQRGQLMLLLLCSLVCLCSSTSAQASIMLPENGVFTSDSEHLLVDCEQKQESPVDTTSSSGPASGQPAVPEEPTPEEDLARQLAAMLATHSEGSTSGTSSSSGGTGGAASGATLLASQISTVPTPSPTGRYAEEQSLFLPDAPGNELLRPPQA